MAVETGSWHRRVLKDGLLVEIRQVTLVKSHPSVHLITRGDAAVGKPPLPEVIAAYIDGEVAVLRPGSVFSHTHGEGKGGSFVLLGQLMPFLHIEIGILPISMQFSSFLSPYHHIHDLTVTIAIEIERCNLRWDGNSGIVRENGWQLLHKHGVNW